MNKELRLQDFLFSRSPSRLELTSYTNSSENIFRISVYRNHSFEMVEHTISAYLDYADIRAEFLYSDYDDSLSFLHLEPESDMLILWIDFSRYSIKNIDSFIQERLSYLKNIFQKPVLFCPFEKDINVSDGQIITFSMEKIKKSLGKKYKDERLEQFSGTKMSPECALRVSKELGLSYIPALLRPALKGIITDLDNTLYAGVLGEDGAEHVQLMEGHARLQQKLKELSQSGFFLCVASKNDEADVKDLFSRRKDFPLAAADFAAIFASWNSKSESISAIAKFLNVHESSLLFIDDNIGELLSVKQAHPEIHLLRAYDDAHKTYDVLELYPGLLKVRMQKEDALRSDDTRANVERRRLSESISHESYLKQLNVELAFGINRMEDCMRVSELSNKTNQFIFNYKRYAVSAIERLVADRNAAVVTVSLKDRLSDSGIIGVAVLKKEDNEAVMEECFVSCRALGRGLDEIIVLGAVQHGLMALNVTRLKILYQKGERNTPALIFINKYFCGYTDGFAEFTYLPDTENLKITIVNGEES